MSDLASEPPPLSHSSPRLRKFILGVLAVLVLCGLPIHFTVNSYHRFMLKTQRAECRTRLERLCEVQKRAYENEHRFHRTWGEENMLRPDRSNLYAYFLAASGPMEDRSTPENRATPQDTAIGVDHSRSRRAVSAAALPGTFLGGVPLGEGEGQQGRFFTAVCAGDIDGDPGLDVWSASTVVRSSKDGERFEPCEPVMEVDDLADDGSVL